MLQRYNESAKKSSHKRATGCFNVILCNIGTSNELAKVAKKVFFIRISDDTLSVCTQNAIFFITSERAGLVHDSRVLKCVCLFRIRVL